MSNKDLLKLENEFRNELPKYREKPKIEHLKKPDDLTRRLSSFLQNASKVQQESNKPTNEDSSESRGARVEMDLFITPIQSADDNS